MKSKLRDKLIFIHILSKIIKKLSEFSSELIKKHLNHYTKGLCYVIVSWK